MSLILESRAKIPGRSSTRSFISFHCFSSFVSSVPVVLSHGKSGSVSINSFPFGLLDTDRLGVARGLISQISALGWLGDAFSRKGEASGSGFGFTCWLRLLFSCVMY